MVRLMKFYLQKNEYHSHRWCIWDLHVHMFQLTLQHLNYDWLRFQFWDVLSVFIWYKLFRFTWLISILKCTSLINVKRLCRAFTFVHALKRTVTSICSACKVKALSLKRRLLTISGKKTHTQEEGEVRNNLQRKNEKPLLKLKVPIYFSILVQSQSEPLVFCSSIPEMYKAKTQSCCRTLNVVN